MARKAHRQPNHPAKAEAGAAGGCLCGAVRYEVRGPLRQVVNCHCGQCRKFHGHFAAYSDASVKDVTVAGRAFLKWFRSSGFARRGFCKRCGSSLFWQRLKGDRIGIAAGTLEPPTRLATVAHIFVDHRGDYYRLADRLKRFPGSMSAG